jgi:serine/threonine protein kinase
MCVRVHARACPRDRYFLVKQFAEHGSLDQYMTEPLGSGGASLRQRLLWVRQIALAVNFLHREDVAHRACVSYFSVFRV